MIFDWGRGEGGDEKQNDQTAGKSPRFILEVTD